MLLSGPSSNELCFPQVPVKDCANMTQHPVAIKGLAFLSAKLGMQLVVH